VVFWSRGVGLSSLISRISNDLQKKEKQVDDIQVEVERGKDVLLGVESVLVPTPHHQLSVKDDVTREDECANGRVHDGEDLKLKL
jgi:hypothetical protein